MRTSGDANNIWDAFGEFTDCVDVFWYGEVEISYPMIIPTGVTFSLYGNSDAKVMCNNEFKGNTSLISGSSESKVYLNDVGFYDCIGQYGSVLYAYDNENYLNNVVFDNIVSEEGAIIVSYGYMYIGNGTFSNNEAEYGASIVSVGSTIILETVTFVNNSVTERGGAVHMRGSLLISYENTVFDLNVAGDDGGGLYMDEGSFFDSYGDLAFSNNLASSGGGYYADDSSFESFGNIYVKNNTARNDGGGISMWGGNMTLDGDNFFNGNQADIGASLDFSYSSIIIGGNTVFSNDKTWEGGSVAVSSSNLNFSGDTLFYNNTAEYECGGLRISIANVSWEGNMLFDSNSAGQVGAAISCRISSNLFWKGNTTFRRNSAVFNGGAIDVEDSTVGWDNTTLFAENYSMQNGGAISVSGDSVFNPGGGIYNNNKADVTGGALYILNVRKGPVFSFSNFTGNESPRGSSVYSVGSGTDKKDSYSFYAITYQNCTFKENVAAGSGGAIETTSGNDLFEDTIFENNMAKIGGALKLAGSTIIENCTFVENISDEDGGAAISNIGVFEMSNSTFYGNDFVCQESEYVDATQGDRYSKICDGCDPCINCNFPNSEVVPVCVEQLDNTRTNGGDTDISSLEIESGYWRATQTSTNVLMCFNEDACQGGISGDEDYCKTGYEGPYCSICSNGFSKSIGFECNKCSDSDNNVLIIIVFSILIIILVSIVLAYLVSADSARFGYFSRVKKYVPIQSVKIVIVVWQILTQFSSIANVTYPSVYQDFLDWLDILNLDIGLFFSSSCIVDVDFYGKLLLSTIIPIVIGLCLIVTYFIGKNKCTSSDDVKKMKEKHMSMLILLTFFVYSNVSSVLFQMFSCEELDDGNNYLRSDYSIQCDSSKHKSFQSYSIFMIIVYAIGIPGWYIYLMAMNKGTDSHVMDQLSSSYKPDRYYYEIVECVRRILLTGVIVFIFPNSASQIAITLVIAFTFFGISEGLSPYAVTWDRWISMLGHVIIFMSMYVGLLLKVDVSDERSASQEYFGILLVISNVLMAIFIVVEGVFILFSIRAERVREISMPVA